MNCVMCKDEKIDGIHINPKPKTLVHENDISVVIPDVIVVNPTNEQYILCPKESIFITFLKECSPKRLFHLFQFDVCGCICLPKEFCPYTLDLFPLLPTNSQPCQNEPTNNR